MRIFEDILASARPRQDGAAWGYSVPRKPNHETKVIIDAVADTRLNDMQPMLLSNDVTPLPLVHIPRNEAHLWCLHSDCEIDQTLTHLWYTWMAEDERCRYLRYRFHRDQQSYLLTRALVRSTLSHYARVGPAEWRFQCTPKGKPYIADPRVFGDLTFNLSNTCGLVVCVVARGGPVGVDVENTTRHYDIDQIARHFFTDDEVKALENLPPNLQRRRFFEYWTLKEAYLKAIGVDLGTLRRVAVRLQSVGTACAAFTDNREDQSASWQLNYFAPTENHVLATAIRRLDFSPVAIKVRTVTIAQASSVVNPGP